MLNSYKSKEVSSIIYCKMNFKRRSILIGVIFLVYYSTLDCVVFSMEDSATAGSEPVPVTSWPGRNAVNCIDDAVGPNFDDIYLPENDQSNVAVQINMIERNVVNCTRSAGELTTYKAKQCVGVTIPARAQDGNVTDIRILLPDTPLSYDVQGVFWSPDDASMTSDELTAVLCEFQLPPNCSMGNNASRLGCKGYFVASTSSTIHVPIMTYLGVTLCARDGSGVFPAAVQFSFDTRKDSTLQRVTLPPHQQTVAASENAIHIRSVKHRCVFVDENIGQLSEVGCRTKRFGSKVTCSCDHSTVFTVLLSVEFFEVPQSVQTLTLVCEAISIFFLLITISSLWITRQSLCRDRTPIQISLSASLLFLHILNISIPSSRQPDVACEVLTVFIHYFLLTSAAWMLIEGLLLSIKTDPCISKCFPCDNDQNMRKVMFVLNLCGWMLPAFYVALTLACTWPGASYMDVAVAYSDSYLKANNTFSSRMTRKPAKYDRCWLATSNGVVIWAAIVPVALMLTINFIIIARTLWHVWRLTNHSNALKPHHSAPYIARNSLAGSTSNLRATVKALAILLPLLGVPWIFGFFVSFYSDNVSVLCIHACFNASQGLSVFVLYCVIKPETRDVILREWKRRISCY